MSRDCRRPDHWDFRLRSAKVGGGVSVRSLVALSLTVAFLATSAALLAPPLQAQSLTTLVSNNASEFAEQWHRLSSSEFRNGRQRGWLHGLRG